MSYTSFRNDQPGDAQPGLLRFQRTNNFGSVVANNLLGEILWEGFDATVPPGVFKSASYIQCKAVGAPAGNVPSELQFNTSFGAGTQLAMTIDQYGRVTLNDPAINEATLVVNHNQTSPNINLRTANATPTNSPHVHFTRSRAGTADVQASDDLGRLEFRGFQGGTAIEAADIRAQAETVNGASVSGSLQFRTRPTTYAAINTRMNISADGNVTINAPISGTALTVTAVAGSLAATFAGSNVGGISVSQANGGASSYQAVQSSVDVQPVYFNAFKNRAGGIIVANDVIYQLTGFGFADTNRTAGLYRIFSTNVGANYVSAGHDWWTTSTAGATNQRMVLSPDGFVGINAPAAAGSALTVNGVNSAANYSLISQAAVAGGIHNAARLWNYDGTAGSATQVSIDVFNQLAATGGDPSLRFLNIGIRDVTLGIDTSTDQFVIANSSALGTSNFLTWTASNNQINLPLQCSFFAYSNASQPPVTGDSTLAQIVFPDTDFNVSNSYNTGTGFFTAPVSGKYLFGAALLMGGIAAPMNQLDLYFIVSGVGTGQSVRICSLNPTPIIFAGQFFAITGTHMTELTAGQTIDVRIAISGGALAAFVVGNAGAERRSYFYGHLLS